MIDWLTLKLPQRMLPDEVARRVLDRAGRVMRLDADGVIEWETLVWDRVRSDLGSVLCRLGDGLEIMGSPARAQGADNAFGTSDIRVAAEAMLSVVSSALEWQLPREWSLYRVTRCDVTESYFLGACFFPGTQRCDLRQLE